MPFVAKEEVQELQTLRTENERMAAQLADFEEMRPHLLLAEEIRNEIVAALENNQEGLDARSIAERAYSNVLKRKVEEARDEVAARYEQEHRRSLYERVLGEVATSEGDDISKKVRTRVETDPELAVELKESARKELAARATDVVRQEITAEQHAVLDKEAERQIGLDRLDVKLALDGELDLASDEVRQQIKPGDKVELFFPLNDAYNQKGKRGRILLVWAKDANGKEGWVFDSSSETFFDQSGYTIKVDSDRFVRIASLNKDFETGDDVVQADKLVVGRQVVLIQKNGKNAQKTLKLEYKQKDSWGDYRGGREKVMLAGSDFQTKDIQFFSASAA